MALSLKVDTEEIPSILKMLGLGGMPAEAQDTGSQPDNYVMQSSENPAPPPAEAGNPPPIDASLGGADNPQSSPGDSSALMPEATPGSRPTKLLRLQQALGNAPPDAPPPLSVVGANTAPLPDLPAPQLSPPKATFREAHPGLFKALGLLSDYVQNAGPGIGAKTFGEGFATAATQPAERAKRALDLKQAQATVAHTTAATDQMKSQVTLPNGLTVPFALAQKLYPTLLTEQGKNTRNSASIDSRESIAGDKNTIAMRKQGLKPNPNDPNGAPVPIGYDDMSPSEQAHYDLLQSQKDATDARAALDKSKNDPNSPAYQAAIGRLRVAQQNANTALGRLGLEKDKYKADYFGTDAQGNALPGATIDDQGRPVGPRLANAAKIPADRLKRGDLASNAISNLDDIAGMVNSNPGLFGKASGRFTTVREMMGSDEPAIREIAIAAHNYALASAGVHGTRSAGAVEKTENELLNHWKDGDTAVLGGISQAKKSLQQFVDNQHLGNKAIPAKGKTPVPPAKTAAPASNYGFVPLS